MGVALERKLNRTWYGGRTPGPWLRLLEQVYRVGRSAAAGFNSLRFARDLQHQPILVVGNLTVGGAGKTPLVIRIAELASSLGLQPGVVSRGYGRRGSAPLWVRGDSDPDEAGDEPVLIAQRTGVPVRVDANRERGVRALLARGVELVISDDGLQRAQLPRALEICVLDGARRLGNGHMLPAGPLREPASRLVTVDYVVVHGEGEPGEHRMRLEATNAMRLDGSEERPAESLPESGLPIHAVAGIARPRRFFDTLAGFGLEVIAHPFPDHHRYRPEDFANMAEQGMIVMTEKDAVKCRGFGLDNAWVLPVSAVLDETLEQALMADIQRIARKSTRKQHEP